jgi:hypothetical protein
VQNLDELLKGISSLNSASVVESLSRISSVLQRGKVINLSFSRKYVHFSPSSDYHALHAEDYAILSPLFSSAFDQMVISSIIVSLWVTSCDDNIFLCILNLGLSI